MKKFMIQETSRLGVKNLRIHENIDQRITTIYFTIEYKQSQHHENVVNFI